MTLLSMRRNEFREQSYLEQMTHEGGQLLLVLNGPAAGQLTEVSLAHCKPIRREY